MKIPFLIAAAVLTFISAGCQGGRSTRIQEKSATFAKLDAATQERLEAGDISLGDSSDLVYIALGKPNTATLHATADGPVETWTYRNFVLSPAMSVQLSNNNPGVRFQNVVIAPGAPRGGPSLSGTQNFGPQASLDSVAGAATGTLHVDLRQGTVIGFRVSK